MTSPTTNTTSTSWPELGKRAAATAAQAGLVLLVAEGANLADVGLWRSAGLAAAAGALSFAHRTIQTYLGHGPAGT